MRFFIIPALFIVPLMVAQFYSTDTYARPGKAAQSAFLVNNAALPKNKLITVDKKLIENTKNTKQRKTKKTHVFTGNKNTKGARLLSVLLMLKGKQHK